MILLREAKITDLSALEDFSGAQGFYNLPDDMNMLTKKIELSKKSFLESLKDINNAKYLFIAEDTETSKVVGTSLLVAKHGSQRSPHFYFQVEQEERFSQMINTGFIHGTLKLKAETEGPTEIGGLIVAPSFRDNEAKVGRQIAFVRFLMMAMYPKKFQKKVLAELLPPFSAEGKSPLWEAVGKQFTNMDYWEADQLCQQNKEFIYELFPLEKIYTTLLPAEARSAIGGVAKETRPIYYMLKKIGFEYQNQVDPFDGGPHLWADVDNVTCIQNTSTYLFEGEKTDVKEVIEGLVCKKEQKKGEFRAVKMCVTLKDKKMFFISSNEAQQAQDVLCIKKGDQLCFMPFY